MKRREFLAAAAIVSLPGIADGAHWHVDIVCDSSGGRSHWLKSCTKEHADEMADWFGREGNLRAEVLEGQAPEPPAPQFEILIVEVGDDPSTATLRRSDFSPSDLEDAQAYSEAFNKGELAKPAGAWAVVRRVVAEATTA